MATGTKLVESPSIVALADFVNKNKSRIQEAMPVGVRAELVTRSLMAVMRQDPSVAACTPGSLKTCLEQMVLSGLDVAKGLLGKAYIVPYGKEAQFQIGYKGIKELVRRSGQGDLVMAEVREGDAFEPQNKFTLPNHVESKAKDRHTRPLTHVYAAYLPNVGRPIVEVWSVERCTAHRDQYSKGYKRAKDKKAHAWHVDNPAFSVMAMKCPVMYLAGRGDLPLSPDVTQLVAAADEAQAIDAQAVNTVAPAAIEAQPQTADDKPPEVDWRYVEDRLNKITTLKQTDDFQKEMIKAFPSDKQKLYERCEEHRELIQEQGK